MTIVTVWTCTYCGREADTGVVGDPSSPAYGRGYCLYSTHHAPALVDCAGLEVVRNDPVVIVLTDAEVKRAHDRAVKVVDVDTERGWKVKFNTGSETRLAINERGFAAELAAAKATGLPLNWQMLTKHYRRADKPPDIGQRTEVRNAVRPHGRLWADREERQSWVYLLVTGSGRTFTVLPLPEGA